MKWDLMPYEALRPICFGMSPADVATVLGPPSGRRVLRRGKVREGRGISTPRVSYVDGQVAEIEFPFDAGSPVFSGTNLFHEDRRLVRQLLASEDADVFEGAGVYVFLGLGFSTNIFHKICDDAASLSAFARGYWDDSMNILRRTQFSVS